MVSENENVQDPQVPNEPSASEAENVEGVQEGEGQGQGQEQLDEKGVPLKNRLAESERKREALESRLSKLEETFSDKQYPTYPPPPPVQPVQQPESDGAKKIDPEVQKLLDRHYNDRRSKERTKEADAWLYRQCANDKSDFYRDAQQLNSIIYERRLPFGDDPVGATRDAYEILKQRRQALAKPDPVVEQEQQVKQEKQATQKTEQAEKIKKTTTTPGGAAPIQKRNVTSDSYNQACKTGKPNDVTKYFFESIDEDKLKKSLE